VELQATDLDIVFYDDFTVPFDPFIEEQVQLEIPMRALCRDDCPGLCPMCGSDRNVAPVTAPRRPTTGWTALKALRPKLPTPEPGEFRCRIRNTTQQDAPRPASRARLHKAQADLGLPEVRHRQAASPRLPLLRLLQGARGDGGDRVGVTEDRAVRGS